MKVGNSIVSIMKDRNELISQRDKMTEKLRQKLIDTHTEKYNMSLIKTAEGKETIKNGEGDLQDVDNICNFPELIKMTAFL